MKHTPLTSLLILLLSSFLFLTLLILFVEAPVAFSQDNQGVTLGEIRPAPAREGAHDLPYRTTPEPPQTLSAQEPFSLTLRATVGLNPHECADQPLINIRSGTRVVVCYFVTNVGSENINLHSVDDKKLGRIVTEQSFPLGGGVSALITSTRIVTETTLHMGTWHGLDGDGVVVASASASAKSYVDGLLIEPGVRQPGGDCWWTENLSLPSRATLDFCYRVVNQTALTLSNHSLTEGISGQLASAIDFPLGPGDSILLQELGLTLSSLVTTTTDYSLAWRATTSDAPTDLPIDDFDNPVPLSAIGTLAVGIPQLTGRLTVGLERDLCAQTTELTVFAGTEIVFCYSATNMGGVVFTHHTITDNFVAAGIPEEDRNLDADAAISRVVRDNEAYIMESGVKGEFTDAQTIDQSATVTMTWAAYSANPADGKDRQSPPLPDTLTFPLPYVSAMATNQVSITVLPLASVSLTLYEDGNQNGERDAGESPIPSATVQLTTTNESPIAAISNRDGIVTFADLHPALYSISISFDETPYIYEPTDSTIKTLLLRSGQNADALLGYTKMGVKPQAIFVPIQVR